MLILSGWTRRIKLKVKSLWQHENISSAVRKLNHIMCSSVSDADLNGQRTEGKRQTEIGVPEVQNTGLCSSFKTFCSLPVEIETATKDKLSPPPSQGNIAFLNNSPILCTELWVPAAFEMKKTCVEKVQNAQTDLLPKHSSPCFSSVMQKNVPHMGFLSPIFTPVFHQRRFVKSVKFEEEHVASTEEIKQVLVQQELRFDQGFACFITKCPRLMQSNKRTKSETGADHLYINMTTGHFLCQHCSKRGGWHDLQDNIKLLSSLPQRRRKEFECFKDLESVQKSDRGSQQAKNFWESAVPIKTWATDVVAQIQENFDIHELHARTLDAYDVRFDIASNSLVFPAYDGVGCLKGVHRLTCMIPEENGNVRVVQGSLLPKTGVLGLFGLNTLTKDVKEVVLTCSEWDAMAVYQETKVPALALPAGISALPQELLPSLERFTKLILWFGDDVRAWEAARLFAKKLNEKRCYIIRPSVEDPSPFEALRRGVKLRSVLDKARTVKHKSIVSFAQLRQEIFSELAHSEQVAGVKWKRYTAMNRLLKGHRRGELTVFTGPTGSGKTTFISDYSLDLCMQGVNTLWGSFEINNVRLGKMMLRQFAQSDLSKHLEDFDEWANRFEELPMYFLTFFGQENIRKVIEAMSHAVYVHDIAHVVVDNLQFMMGSNGEWADRFSKQDAFVAAFRKFATNMNCHVTLVVHPRKEKDSEDLTTASVFGSAKATQEADNVLILQDKRLSSVRGRKYLQITKNRFDGELGVMLLRFDKESLSFAVREKTTKHISKEDASLEEIPHVNPISEDTEFPTGEV